MRDPRVDRLAELVAGYSLALREGDLLRIEGHEPATPLVVAMYGAALRRGANPYTAVELEGLEEVLVAEGSDEQIDHLSPVELGEVRAVDAAVTIWGKANTRSATRLDPERAGRREASRRPVFETILERLAGGELRWCGTMMPTNGHAQDAEMSLEEYERFVFGACHVLAEEDAVAHWTAVSRLLQARARELGRVSELRILGPDTDLRLGVAGRRWRAADGKLNMPDGEVYTSPVETETEGEIRFTFPAIFSGREVEDVRLTFEGGRVVDCDAARGAEFLRSMLRMDGGASVLGEVAFGLNYEIDRFTGDILFDEKIGGTMHVALGAGFAEIGGRNESALHWDMICDLRAEGEVLADGEPVWRAGRFLRDPDPDEVAEATSGG